VPSVDKYLTVRGHSFRYFTEKSKNNNKGICVLFFHGFSFSLDDWKKTGTTERIVDAGYSALAMDLPSGRASKSDKISYHKVSECIPIIDEFLEKANFFSPEKKAVIIGPSMGGGFALEYAMMFPQKVEGLVLVSPSLKSIDEERLEVELSKIPVMLVWGDRDNVFPLEECGRPLKEKLARSKLLVIKGAGHAAYLDKPEEFNDLLYDFLDELSS